MKRTMKRMMAVLLALTVVFGALGGSAGPVWAARKDEAKPIGLSEKVNEVLTTEYDESFGPYWYSDFLYVFTSEGAGDYVVKLIAGESEGACKYELKTWVFDSHFNELGAFTAKPGQTLQKTFELLEGKTYYLEVETINITSYGWKSTYPEDYPELTGSFSLCVDRQTERPLKNAAVSYTKKWAYTGSAIKPAVKLTYEGTELQKGKDYKVSYSNNTNIGTGTIKLTGLGSYAGTLKYTFTICPKKEVISSLTSPKAKTATVKIKKDSMVAGYQISYSLTSDFKKSKTATTTATSKSFTLTSGKTYYFRVRGIAKNGTAKLYGAWSAVKKVKVN